MPRNAAANPVFNLLILMFISFCCYDIAGNIQTASVIMHLTEAVHLVA